MTRKEKAMQNFQDGYNCSQALVMAFSDILPVNEKELKAMSSSFGGGMGRLREVCGGVTGMFIVAGLLYGYDTPETGEVKAAHYARIQELARLFEERYGCSYICRDLLGLSEQHSSSVPEARTPEYYDKRPCKAIVGLCAEILEEYIEGQTKTN